MDCEPRKKIHFVMASGFTNELYIIFNKMSSENTEYFRLSDYFLHNNQNNFVLFEITVCNLYVAEKTVTRMEYHVPIKNSIHNNQKP